MKFFFRKIYKTLGITYLLLLAGSIVFSVLGIVFVNNNVLCLLSILLTIISFTAAIVVGKRKAKAYPKHKERVKVLDIKQEFYDMDHYYKLYTLAFEFPDSSMEVMRVHEIYVRPKGVFELVGINDTGILTYEEFENRKCFVSFEKDP